MKISIKPLLIVGAVAGLLMAALYSLGNIWAKEYYGDLLLVRPLAYGAPGFQLGPLEEFCAQEFLLTYEIPRKALAGVDKPRQSITLVGTNSCYGQILGIPLGQGAFFTAAAFKNHSKEAVLNEKAAWQIFGSYNICGQTIRIEDENWLVVGVLQDSYEDEGMIYVPASLRGDQPASLLIPLDKEGSKFHYVQNALKQLGIYDTNYELVRMSAVGLVLEQALGLVWRLGGIFALILLLIGLWQRLGQGYSWYQGKLQYQYRRELILQEPVMIVKIFLPALAFLAALALLLVLAVEILALGLNLTEIWPDFKSTLQIIRGGKIWHI